MRKALIALSIIIAVVIVFISCGYFASQRLDVEYYRISGNAEKITICHLSDLHYPKNGIEVEKILNAVSKEKPDIIVMTGDMLDESAKSDSVSDFADFLYSLRKIAPTFAVPGNHEVGKNYDLFQRICDENDVTLLVDKSECVTINHSKIMITGLNDGRTFSERNLPEYFAVKERAKPDINILLAHRPELIHNYLGGGFDIVFCGHAHGGQARFFGVGIYSPDQGFFPSYTSGRYVLNDTVMFISRGLGDGNNSFRIYNSYNINIVTVA